MAVSIAASIHLIAAVLFIAIAMVTSQTTATAGAAVIVGVHAQPDITRHGAFGSSRCLVAHVAAVQVSHYRDKESVLYCIVPNHFYSTACTAPLQM